MEVPKYPQIVFRLSAEDYEQLLAAVAEEPTAPQSPPLWVKGCLLQLLAKRRVEAAGSKPAPVEHTHSWKTGSSGITVCSCGKVKS